MSVAILFSEGAAWGLPVMKFTLTFDGPLPASANKPKNDAKWEIRKHFHPQLVDLWETHPALQAVEANRSFPRAAGTMWWTWHHADPARPAGQNSINRADVMDLCENINKHGKLFRPLVRETYALHCGLKIVFLRNEPPGKVYQGGDLDGRIKTLLDALAMPQHKEQIIEDSDAPNPLYCLLEDDAMISGIAVESEKLLAPQNRGADHVRLNIEVDVRVRQAAIYNQSFLGG